MSMDFAALGAQATEMINTASSEATSQAAAAAPASQPATQDPNGAQQPVQGASQPSTQQPAAVADPNVQASGQPVAEPTFQVDLGNGRVESLTQSQLKEAYLNGLRQADYTKKTQEAAQLRQQAEQVLSHYNNPQNILTAAQRLLAQQQPQAPQQPIDPNKPITVGEMQQVMSAMNQQYQQLGQQAQAYVEDRLAVANYAENINSELGKIYDKYPSLKALPEYEDVLRYRVAQSQPASLEEAVQRFNTIAAEMHTKIGGVFTQQQQQQAAAKQQFVQSGAEGPGGAAPAQQAPKYTDNRGRVDWTRLGNAAKTQFPL